VNLKLMLEESAKRYSDKTAILSGDRRLSFTDLDNDSNKVANALIRMGIEKGDRVAILSSNSPEFAITYFGIIKTGAILVPLDPNYKVEELASLFNDSQPKLLIAENPYLESLIPALSRFKSIEQVVNLSPGLEDKFASFHEIIADGNSKRIDLEPDPEDIVSIAYTSGPSFDPRGVMSTHQCFVKEVAIMGETFQQTDKDVVMLYALPMHHAFGLLGAVLTPIYKGSTIVMVPGTGLSIGSCMATIERERGTIFMGVPFIFALAIDLVEKEGIKIDLSSLRFCFSAGAPISIDRIQRFKQHYGVDILDGWGMTEASCLVTFPPIDGSGKLGSIGKAITGWEAKIVDDDGRELPANQAGEMILRGPIMVGYYNNPQATAEVIKDGWLYTGDMGRLDEDGYLFITGRKKDSIIIKGQNTFPSDIENVIRTHSAVAEVTALGIRDEMRGEVIGVVLSLQEGKTVTEQEIKQFCLERMASYKAPKQVMFLDSLPRTTTGQIDKERIRERLSIPSPF